MIRYFSEAAVRRCLDEARSFRLAEEAFRLIARKKTQMPPKTYLYLSGSDFRAMPALVQTAKGGACGVKWVSVYPQNRRWGLPTVHASVLLSSHKTGASLALLEANTLTALRTAAASAVATHYLANPKPKKLALIGAGVQAEYQLRALAARYAFREVSVWGPKKGEVDGFCRRLSKTPFALKAARRPRACVEDADIIVTCTPSRKPLLQKGWIKRGAHLNAIGADAKGKQELDPAILLSAKVVVDEWEQASHSGEINVAVSRGIFSKKDLHAPLAEVVSGKKAGRTSRSEITVFDSTGLAVLDIYFAHHVYEASG